MAKNPIRNVIGRALEKGGRLEDLIAVPMLFDAESQRHHGPQEFIKTEGPHGIYYPLNEVEVRRVWYRENSIEIELNNGMQVSIETKPLTFAMRLRTEPDDKESGFFQVQLIREDEPDSMASLVEARLRSLRQVYAVAYIAYSWDPAGNDLYSLANFRLPELFGVEERSVTDFEDYLDLSDRLLIGAAGQGSLWVTVGLKAVAAAKAVPKAALIALSTIFSGGPERIVRVGEALVREREGIAQETQAKARIAEAQAAKLDAEVVAARAAASEATAREAVVTEEQRFDLQKKKMDAFFEIRDKIAKMGDGKEALLTSFDNNVVSLLGETAKDWMRLPPSSN